MLVKGSLIWFNDHTKMNWISNNLLVLSSSKRSNPNAAVTMKAELYTYRSLPVNDGIDPYSITWQALVMSMSHATSPLCGWHLGVCIRLKHFCILETSNYNWRLLLVQSCFHSKEFWWTKYVIIFSIISWSTAVRLWKCNDHSYSFISTHSSMC